jgi:hypothetical protein
VSKPSKPLPKFANADRKLDPAQFKTLNAEFYQGFHQELMTTRLGVLCLLHEKPDLIKDLLIEGVSWGEIKMRREPEEGSTEILKRNAELELVVLRQHSAEVLFRLFWVHAHREPCPWLALARFRTPSELKSAVDKYLEGHLWVDEESRRLFHAKEVWGTLAIADDGEIKEQFASSVEAVAQWIAVAATLVLDAPLYNAYKHGMAVVASEPFSLSIGGPDALQSVSMSASAGFKYINRASDELERRHFWQVVSDPVDFGVAAGEIAAFSTLMGAILDAGAFDRGVTKLPQEIPIFNSELTPAKVQGITGKPGMTVTRFADSLAYFK